MPPITVVDAEMRFQIAHNSKGSPALCTLEGLLSSVASDVHFKVGSVAELFRAIFADEAACTVRVLRAYVATERARVRELFLAMRTR